MEENKIIIPITPQTWVRTTANAKTIFRIPEECPYNCGLPRVPNSAKRKKNGEGVAYCTHCLSHTSLMYKRRLIKYSNYKNELNGLCKELNFDMPSMGWSLYFYLPMPKRWNKTKRAALHGQPHMRKPDLDNLQKSTYDSLRVNDEYLAQLSGAGKFWVDTDGEGWIEILLNQPIYDPFGVINPDTIKQVQQEREAELADVKYRKPVAGKKIKASPSPYFFDAPQLALSYEDEPKQWVEPIWAEPLPKAISVDEFNEKYRDRVVSKKTRKRP